MARAPADSTRQVSILSNQYKLSLGAQTCVYQYALRIKPDEFWEAHHVHEVVRTKRNDLERALGTYCVSGQSVYVLSELEDSFMFKTKYRGQQASIHIEKETCAVIRLTDTF